MPSPSAVSAPGKVLFAGGYLVLDREYSGLVFGLNARVHVVSSLLPETGPPGTITVVSPQFERAGWDYQISKSESGHGLTVKQVELEGYG